MTEWEAKIIMMMKEKVKVRVPVLLTIATIVTLSPAGNYASATSASIVASIPFAESLLNQSATRFASGYTPLTKCGSGMTKKEEKEAEEQGSDIPSRCKGLGGYDVFISYSACASSFSLEKGVESISLGMQAVDWKQKTVEWRLANGKPFAIIMRVYEYAGTNECAMAGKITGESLIVRGLKGYEQINKTVEVKSTPNPNVKARELADQGYAKPRA